MEMEEAEVEAVTKALGLLRPTYNTESIDAVGAMKQQVNSSNRRASQTQKIAEIAELR